LRLDALHCVDAALGDCLDEVSMVSLVEIGIPRGELRDGAIESVARSQVRGNCDSVA
jgi:hypothetical protein